MTAILAKTAKAILAATLLASCDKIDIHLQQKETPAQTPRITTTTDGPCTSAQIEGLHTKSDTPTIEIKTRKGTDSILGQKHPDGQIYISLCLENDKRLRRSLRKRSTAVTVTDEDGTKTTIKKGRH